MTTTVAPCARCHSPLEAGDLRCAVCALATPALPGNALVAARSTAIRCSQCGAGMRYSAEAAAPTCAFCGARTQVETQADPVEEPEAQLRFEVPPAEARARLERFLARRTFFRPADLASAATLESLRPLYWPAWLCRATAEVSWAADSDGGARRSAWAPHAGTGELAFDAFLVPASKGLSLGECHALLPRFRCDAGRRQPVGEGPEGTVHERFEATRSAARRIVVGALEEEAKDQLRAGIIPGSRFRNVAVELLLRGLSSERLLLPTYVLAYRYRSRVYRVLVHGQDPDHVIGEAPRSPWKVALVAFAVAAAVALALGLLTR